MKKKKNPIHNASSKVRLKFRKIWNGSFNRKLKNRNNFKHLAVPPPRVPYTVLANSIYFHLSCAPSPSSRKTINQISE